eukprot:TCALIF_11221-PA protein Name:"Similar to Fig4 Polyphosphoinositide phosphatase (Mus musculus)" AED:0.27 eAED:0.27 QI:0/0/0/0.63/0.9/0.72/11/0/1202
MIRPLCTHLLRGSQHFDVAEHTPVELDIHPTLLNRARFVGLHAMRRNIGTAQPQGPHSPDCPTGPWPATGRARGRTLAGAVPKHSSSLFDPSTAELERREAEIVGHVAQACTRAPCPTPLHPAASCPIPSDPDAGSACVSWAEEGAQTGPMEPYDESDNEAHAPPGLGSSDMNRWFHPADLTSGPESGILSDDGRGVSPATTLADQAGLLPRAENGESLGDGLALSDAGSSISRASQIRFHSFVKTVQRIVIYETRARYYVVGSNNTETQFRVLNIHRNEPRDLVITDDQLVYDTQEIKSLLMMADVGNRSKVGQKVGYGLTKTLSAFGIAGFVRFLEGYYILLITKRRKAAMIGHHCIYKIEDTSLLYIPNDDIRESHPDEARYRRMFQAVDMSSNFYYSYSYDLTRTLQFNLTKPKFLRTSESLLRLESIRSINSLITDFRALDEPKRRSVISIIFRSSFHFLASLETKVRSLDEMFPDGRFPSDVGYQSQPNVRYLWNDQFINHTSLNQNWVIHIIYGFIDQSNISVYGRPILLTLIARRSRKFAGTRFLKRGANFQGDVANEVETEQIVVDSTVLDLHRAKMTSFVQIRGSVPSHWSQDVTKMVPKPQIFFELSDPHGRTSGKSVKHTIVRQSLPVQFRDRWTDLGLLDLYVLYMLEFGACKIQRDAFFLAKKTTQLPFVQRSSCVVGNHFNNLMENYGSPVVVLNLVKKREKKRPHEGLLGDEFQNQIEYLNQFLPVPDRIKYIPLDMARCKKREDTEVIQTLADIAHFALFALGLIDTPNLEYESDCARMLEVMYEDHGDTLALQYGGSQLIHRQVQTKLMAVEGIKSYRKESKWTSKATDIAQTLRRYYSNTLSDAEKQNAINLFLGVFVPKEGQVAIWDKEFITDKYLHSPQMCRPFNAQRFPFYVTTHWFSRDLRLVLPLPLTEYLKECTQLKRFSAASEEFDLYQDYYRPFELSVLNELFPYREVSHSVRDYMPNCCTEYSPFVVRQREVKRREESIVRSSKNSFAEFLFGKKSSPSPNSPSAETWKVKKNPSVAGVSSTASTLSNASDSDDVSLSSSQEFVDWMEEHPGQEEIGEEAAETTAEHTATFQSLLKVMDAGVAPAKIQEPDPFNMSLYRGYTMEGEPPKAEGSSIASKNRMPRGSPSQELFSLTVQLKASNLDIYRGYCRVAEQGAQDPNDADIQLYHNAVNVC